MNLVTRLITLVYIPSRDLYTSPSSMLLPVLDIHTSIMSRSI